MFQKKIGKGRFHRERTPLLNGWLALSTLIVVVSLFQGIGRFSNPMINILVMGGAFPKWWFPVVIFGDFLNLGCLVGIWMWKRWGIYGIVALTIAGLVITLIAGFPINRLLILACIRLAIWWIVLRNDWVNFD